MPDRFLRIRSLAFGGNFYLHLPSSYVQPYVGIGVMLLVNSVKSAYSGPGTYAVGMDGVPLDSTSLGVGFHVPIGVRVPVNDSWFLYGEFRPGRNYFSYVSGDKFQREKDRFVLQTFQGLLGVGFVFN